MLPKDRDPKSRSRERLEVADRKVELAPWKRAQELTEYFLYWMPGSFPLPMAQREWLMKFLDRLIEFLTKDDSLRVELFVQQKTIRPLINEFVKAAVEWFPITGLGSRPGVAPASLPTGEELQSLQQKALKSGQVPDVTKFMQDYCYWFLKKKERQQRELLLGLGGIVLLFLKPDPNTVPPKVPLTKEFRKKWGVTEDLESIISVGSAMRDSFLPKSKQIFGKGLQEEPGFEGLPFILPLLQSRDFLKPKEATPGFELYDVYFCESPEDGGMLMASKMDFEESLIDLLQQMKGEGLVYPEG